MVFSRQEKDESVSFVCKKNDSRQFYRFGEIEYFIIQQLNGKNTPDVIRVAVENKYGSPLDQQTLQGFIDSLAQRGLLEGVTDENTPAQYGQRSLKGSLLYLRFSLFDPDRLLNILAGKLHFIFTPWFVGSSAVLIALGLITLLAEYGEIQRDIDHHLALGSLFSIWLVILVTVICHEMAHGLTCKYFGGDVHEIGFLLIFLMPAFFCNVSDAWLFSKKSHRLWVTFAGAYCELFLWALSLLIWRITAPETLLNFLALTMIGASGIRILFNFNPLIKLDGYYLLSDYLDMPNLRTRASGYLGYRIRRLFSRADSRPDETDSRERRIYLLYGICAGLFSIILLGYMASLLGAFLIEQLQGPGFILFVVLLMIVFKRHLLSMARRAGSLFRWKNPGIRRVPRKLVYFSAVMVLLFIVEMNLTISGEFQVYPVHNADVRSKLDEIIEEVYVIEGQWVDKGAPVARLSDTWLLSELGKVDARIREEKANLKLLLVGPSKVDIDLARGRVEQAEVRYQHALLRADEAEKMHVNRISKLKVEMEKAQAQQDYARKKRNRFHVLATKDLVPDIKIEEVDEEATVRQKEYNEARAEWKMALANVNAETRQEMAEADSAIKLARSELDVLLAGSRTEEIEATQAVIAGLENELQHIQDQLKQVEVLSPITGIVTTPKPGEMVGQRIEKGELIMEVYDTHKVKVETLISEKEIGDVKVGQKVALKARAYPGENFYGRVVAIAPVAMSEDEGIRRKVVRVITDIDNPSLLLKPEMTGQTKIYAGKSTVFDLLTRRLVRYVRVEFWSWW